MKERKYEVETQKFIPTPEYGPYSFRTQTYRKDFEFGKGKKYKNGEEACLNAYQYAIQVSKYSDVVIVSRLENNDGPTFCIKNNYETNKKDLEMVY
jgi:hypothetical protein